MDDPGLDGEPHTENNKAVVLDWIHAYGVLGLTPLVLIPLRVVSTKAERKIAYPASLERQDTLMRLLDYTKPPQRQRGPTLISYREGCRQMKGKPSVGVRPRPRLGLWIELVP